MHNVRAGAVALAIGLAVAGTHGALAQSGASNEGNAASEQRLEGAASAIFAGGCFWCVEADFDKVPGVLSTTSGYTGGRTENPDYESVTYGDTGHYEAVRVTYDPTVVEYSTLVDYFFRHVDPTDAGGQFCDRGDSYRTAVFVDGKAQRATAQAALTAVKAQLDEEVVTPILDAAPFYEAEAYHQDYYEKKPLRYKYYRWRCGRDERIAEIWADAEPAS